MCYTVRIVDWSSNMRALQEIRKVVFVDEQSVPEELEWDDNDPGFIHALAFNADNNPIATGRLLPTGKIGRMAVLKVWRGHGVGSAILTMLTDEAIRSGIRQITLDAQVDAIGFYRKHGYETFGKNFMDAGIEHIKMRRTINPQS